MTYGGPSYGAASYGSTSDENVIEVDVSLKTTVTISTNISSDETISTDASQIFESPSLTTTTDDLSKSTENSDIQASATAITADLQSAFFDDQTVSVDESALSNFGTLTLGAADVGETVELLSLIRIDTNSSSSFDSGITSDNSLLSGAVTAVKKAVSASVERDISELTQTAPARSFFARDDSVEASSLDISSRPRVVGSPAISDESAASIESPISARPNADSVSSNEITASIDTSNRSSFSILGKDSNELTESADESTISISDAQTTASVDISEASTNVSLTGLQKSVPFSSTDSAVLTKSVEQPADTTTQMLAFGAFTASRSSDSPLFVGVTSSDKKSVSLSTVLDGAVQTRGSSLSKDALLKVAASAASAGPQSNSIMAVASSTSLDKVSRAEILGEIRTLADSQDNTSKSEEPEKSTAIASVLATEEARISFTDASITATIGVAGISEQKSTAIEKTAQTNLKSAVKPSSSKSIATDSAILTNAAALSKLGVADRLTVKAADSVLDAGPTIGGEITSSVTAASAKTSRSTSTVSQATAFSVDTPVNTASSGIPGSCNEVSSSFDESTVSVSSSRAGVRIADLTTNENISIVVSPAGAFSVLSDSEVVTLGSDASIKADVVASSKNPILVSSAEAVGSRIKADTVAQRSSENSLALSREVSSTLASLADSPTRERVVLSADGSSFSTEIRGAGDKSSSVAEAFEPNVSSLSFVSEQLSEAIEESIQTDSATAVKESNELTEILDTSNLSFAKLLPQLGESLSQALDEGDITVTTLTVVLLTADDIFFNTSSIEDGLSTIEIDNLQTKTKKDGSITNVEVE
jgi:hypothetical protein